MSSQHPEIPEPSKFLIYIALLFVPGVYILLILSALIVLGIGGGLIYLIISLGRVNGRLIIIMVGLGIGVIMGCIAVLKGIINSIWRKPDFEPALLIDLHKEPELGKFIARLCAAMETKPPDSVILHANPTAFVTQGRLQVLNGEAKGRILAIGLPFMAGLSINDLRAILCHEFAHYTGQDCTYSSVVYPVYAGAATAAEEMDNSMHGENSSISVMIPMLVPKFSLWLYLTTFHLLNMQISRSRERRADALAAHMCGTEAMKTALTRSVGVDGAFAHMMDNEFTHVLRQGRVVNNIYSMFRQSLPDLTGVADAYVRKSYIDTPSKWDSHPTMTVRIRQLPNFPDKFTDNVSALSLITYADYYEKTLSEKMTQLVSNAVSA